MTDRYVVLYVDDEWSNRVVFEQTFAKSFRVKTVASGQEALVVLATEPVAVLLTDQRMPEMSGNDLLEKAKQLHPEVIRVVITAYSDLDPILRAVNEGLVTRYVVKPWDRVELEAILAWGVEAFTLGREQSNIQLRLMNTERLVTLGSIAGAVFHDAKNILGRVKNSALSLERLSASTGPLRRLLETHAASLPEAERHALMELLDELPAVANDVAADTQMLEGLTGSMQKLLQPPGKPEEPIDPVPVIRYALSIFRDSTNRTKLSYDGPWALPKVKIGSTELTQVLLNLISNALQSLEGANRPGNVTVRAIENGPWLALSIVDDGPGMSAEVLAKVGTPFFTTREQGSGLGLAQCHRLIEREGGNVTVTSTPGAGAHVTFTVPKV